MEYVKSGFHRAMAEALVANAMALAEDMRDNSLHPSTKRGYQSCMKTMGRWTKAMGVGDVDEDGFPTIPLGIDSTMAFFGALVEPRTKEHAIFGRQRDKMLEKNGGQLSLYSVQGYRSAIRWLYGKNGAVVEKDLEVQIKQFIAGYKNKVASLRLSGSMSTKEGKLPLTFSGYQFLSRTFFALTPTTTSRGNHRGDGNAVTFPMGIFAWTFILFQWNLIARLVL
jgi:hypothetical protein